MHQQSHFTRPGAATASLGWDQQDTSRSPCLRWASQGQCWCESCGMISPSRGQGQQELLRLRTAEQPREGFLCSPGLSQCSLRNQGHLLLTHFSWGSPHHMDCVVTAATQSFWPWGHWTQKDWWALFHSLLNVSNSFSSLKELIMRSYFCPWFTEGKW